MKSIAVSTLLCLFTLACGAKPAGHNALSEERRAGGHWHLVVFTHKGDTAKPDPAFTRCEEPAPPKVPEDCECEREPVVPQMVCSR